MSLKFNESLVKLANEINYELNDQWIGVSLDHATLDRASKSWSFEFTFDSLLDFKEFITFRNAVEKRFKKIEFNVNVVHHIRNKQIIIDYLNFHFKLNNQLLYKMRSFISMDNVELTENEFILHVDNYSVSQQLHELKDQIKASLVAIGFDFYEVVIKYHEKNTQLEKSKKIDNWTSNFDSLKEEYNKLKKQESPERPKYSKKNNKAIALDIKEVLNSFEPYVSTKGEIYKLESKTLNEKTLFTLAISDYVEAITIKCFSEDEKALQNLKIGQTIIANGKLVDDTYVGSKVIIAKPEDIIITEDLQKLEKDYAETPRVELAVRTRISTQDGICEPISYLQAAEHYGFEAIAITDYEGVQSFPDFYNVTKKSKKVKPIYGVTLNAINTHNNFFLDFNNQDFLLKEQTYVVFDIETTGLSARFNEIIEFGAVIVQNGIMIKKEQFFLIPKHPIPASITRLTKIDDDLVRQNGMEYEKGILRIYEILKDKIAVAHNASFDITVCRENFVRLGLDISRIIGLDTLALSHYLFSEFSKFKLGTIAKKFNVYYDSEVAHRADYDAEILSSIWIQMIAKLKKEKNIETAMQLHNVIAPETYDKKMAYEVRLLAKNQLGLKKLFKIVSKALTSQYHGQANIYINEWKHDDDLFFGSGTHRSYLWDRVLLGDEKSIIEALEPFDYVELPPISTFSYLYNDDWITRDQIEWAYKDLISKAKKMNKICVAVSDARYIYEYQNLIHRIYINARQLGNTSHWLKKYSNIALPAFKLLTTTEMLQEFNFLNDGELVNEIVINNPKKMANSIASDIQVIKDKLYVPNFDDSANKLKETVYANAKAKYGENIDPLILQRIERELNPIIKYGYSVIYWISKKLVERSNKDGYMVGSRGSVGSSIVANLSGISEVNPLPPHYLCLQCKKLEWNKNPNIRSGWDLPDKNCPNCNVKMEKDGHSIPFETFLGFEADKVPDIDLNFSGDYQPIIHNYVRELFGDSHTLRAGTVSTVADKTAYGFCKKYDEEIHSIDSGKSWSSQFIEFIASKTAGIKRTTGQHPGGIIIIPKEFDVEDFTSISYPANDINSDWKTTHFDFHSIHDNVLKLDLLGHDDPTVVKMLEEVTNTSVRNIPKSDEKVISLFSSTEALGIKPEDINGETTGAYGLPEFGTSFVRRMLKTAKPKSFNDLILMSGLSHGTDVWNGNAEELIKEGKQLTDCVCCRDDIMLNLLEWNLEPLQAFSIMEKVRKGKGLTEEEEKLLKEHNIPNWYINSLKKIKYMFPKAHATAYVMMAWRIAWYKLYYPLAFYASYYSNRPDAIDIRVMSLGKHMVSSKLYELKSRDAGKKAPLTKKEQDLIPILEITQELYARGFKIQNVDLKRSHQKLWLVDQKNQSLIPPFNCVDGLGETVANTIVSARNESPFLSIEDLIERTKLNSRILETLRNLGVLDELSETNQNELF
ncbi:PolC-type DNA polymerase III [[Mycoplasma] anseris]|uniref:DNA polymerase III PolC-type n=1 Tax=[Mycoplasma] anseris TaxID=92400 RepID=A0A2Z4ND65_9BACT|nr:PolC-type DNA polymerase III [[Mycoplasma] anseris]AWX69436.1 PolC-type DNA polymerase III [[Mycoplasma] anseris]